MDPYRSTGELRDALSGVVDIHSNRAHVCDGERLKAIVDRLAASAAFGATDVRYAAHWVLRAAASDLGAWPASIQPFYTARGRGEWHGLTVPAINTRFGYPQLRGVLRAALDLGVGAVTLEMARSEMEYTETRPAEFAAGVFAAAIREGWRGPLFIQGDHFQVNAKRYATEPEAELVELELLIDEAVAAGFYNIDIDSSTLVDLAQPTVEEQQRPNFAVAARLATRVRKAQPDGIVISVGGEIGEVGGKNSTVEELVAYVDGLNASSASEALPGPSKISVQTGTSHGGVVLADGSVAKVSIDFDVLRELSAVSRKRYGMAGAVQHGASTLPDELFHRFPELETAEIHLATGYQNALYDSSHFSEALREEIYAYLRAQFGGRQPGQTDAQLIYRERKRAIGPFKRHLWDMANWDELRSELYGIFVTHFRKLGVANTRDLVARFTPRVEGPLPSALPW